MGVLWTVWPLDEKMKSWLDETGVPYPQTSSRWPKGSEIKAVVASLGEFDVEVSDNGIGGTWRASIVSRKGGDEGEWTLLNISRYSGDDEEQELWFEKGWESLITRILGLLAVHSGPLVLIPDTGDDPAVISGSAE